MEKQDTQEEELKFRYKYPHPSVTTDCVIFGFDGNKLEVLLVKRGIDPFKGNWALPGGFVRMEESAEESVSDGGGISSGNGIEAVAREVDAYRSIRATVQLGALHRLMGLDGGNEYAWLHESEDGGRVVVCYVQARMTPNSVSHRLRLSHLDPAARYRLDGTDVVRTGAELMGVGLALGKICDDAWSRRWVLDRVG